MEIRAVRFAVYNGKHSGNPPHTSMQNIREKDRHRTRFRHEMNRCTWKHAARRETSMDDRRRARKKGKWETGWGTARDRMRRNIWSL